MSITLFLLIVVIVLALAFDFLNGIHDFEQCRCHDDLIAVAAASSCPGNDCCGGISAVPLSLAWPWRKRSEASSMPNAISLQVLIAALASAILWNLLTWYLGFPSSSSHALIGGLIGAVLIGAGWQAINLD